MIYALINQLTPENWGLGIRMNDVNEKARSILVEVSGPDLEDFYHRYQFDDRGQLVFTYDPMFENFRVRLYISPLLSEDTKLYDDEIIQLLMHLPLNKFYDVRLRRMLTPEIVPLKPPLELTPDGWRNLINDHFPDFPAPTYQEVYYQHLPTE